MAYNIEDLIQELDAHFSKNKHQSLEFDNKFINDMARFVSNNKPLTTRQLDVAIKVLKRYKSLFPDQIFDNIIDNKICRIDVVESLHIPREVRYLGDNILAFRSKFDQVVINAIKSTNRNNHNAVWDANSKLWLVRVTDKNLSKIMQIIKNFKFDFDDRTLVFLTACENSRNSESEITLKEDGNIAILVQNDPIFDLFLTQMEWEEDNV